MPKGTLRGSPAVPGDDLTTLRVNFYLVAQKKLDNDLIGDLTQALLNARRDLLGKLPILAQLSAPTPTPTRICRCIPERPPFTTAPS